MTNQEKAVFLSEKVKELNKITAEIGEVSRKNHLS